MSIKSPRAPCVYMRIGLDWFSFALYNDCLLGGMLSPDSVFPSAELDRPLELQWHLDQNCL